VNTFRPEQRPKYTMEVLAYHEAVPGHHLQLAIQQELTGLPKFRRQVVTRPSSRVGVSTPRNSLNWLGSTRMPFLILGG